MTENIIYFLSGVLTSSVIFYILYLVSKRKSRSRVLVTQSEIYQVLRFFNMEPEQEPKTTQAMQIAESKPIRFVQTTDGRLFWMDNNVLYWTEVADEEELSFSSGKEVNTKDLSSKEMLEILTILDALQNG